jgi:hypothetical protein
MLAAKDQQPLKPRSTARSWSRIEAIDRQIVKHEDDIATLKDEREGIVRELEAVLKPV